MEHAQKLFNRLTEVEKIQIRGANQGRLDFFADTIFRSDLPDTTFDYRCSVVTEVHALCLLEMSVKGNAADFGQVTWKF